MMIKAQLDVEASNLAIADGSLAGTIGAVLDACRPEAAYFLTEDGKRTMIAFFDQTGPDQIPVLAEPLFQSLNAEVRFNPVMNRAELEKGLQAWAAARV